MSAATELDRAWAESGAFCSHAHVTRPVAGRGPLAGLAFAVKDVFEIEGERACYGNPTWLESHPPASRTAPSLRRLLDTGASLSGVTVTDELALSLTGENVHYGTPRNPRARGRIPGGSSAGSAVAVASGLVPFALGTDTGGSVRVPASHCGVFGFRPSHGAIDSEGVLPLAPRFDTVGWFAENATLLALAGDVLLPRARREWHPRELAVFAALAPFCGGAAWQAFTSAAQRVAERLELRLTDFSPSPALPPPDAWLAAYLTLQNTAIRHLHGAWLREHAPSCGTLIARRFERVLASDERDVPAAETTRAKLDAELTAALDSGTWLLLPSAPDAPPLLGSSDDDVDAFTGRGLTLSAAASLCGLPQVSLPVIELPEGPLGLSIIAPRGADRALLELAKRAAGEVT
jgi:amidase